MIHDKNLVFSKDQAIGATAASTDYLDLGSDRDIGPGEQLWLVLISKAAPGGTSPTLAIALETDDNSSFNSPTSLWASGTLAAAALAAGTMIVVPFPWTNERYVRVKYTQGGSDTPTHVMDAFLTNQHPPAIVAYPDASIV